MKSLADIARDTHQDLEHLRVLEACGHFKGTGGLYDPAEVRAAMVRTSPAAPLAQFSRLLAMARFFSEAKTWKTFQVRCAAASHVLNRGHAKETKADAARRLNISREHFSRECSRFAEVTLLR